MLVTQSLYYSYGQNTDFHYPDIMLGHGEDLLILGESGVGKTTLLHLLAGILHPISGSIRMDDTVLTDLMSAELDRFRGNHIGLVFQRPHFIQSVSLQENLQLVQHLANKRINKERICQLLDSMGLIHKLKERTNNLSQGEQQRASIALAVVNKPKLILADEPTSSLDDKNCLKELEVGAINLRLLLLIVTDNLQNL